MRKAPQVALCAGLAAIVLLGFSGVVRNGFTGYDDGEYVTENPHVNTGLTRANFQWAWTAANSSNWHPLTWISHELDCELFGLAPAGHHLTSLLMHALNSVLLFLWLQGATGDRGRSAFVALVFGLHPLHVESVAWISERKDVLSTMFGLLALLAYSAYSRKPGPARYLCAAVLFTASLLSKPMLVTLPLLLLLMDWWPLRRDSKRALVVEKLPLLLLAGLATAATIWAHRQSASITTLEELPLSLRLFNAAVSYMRYLGKTVWPTNLAVFYPFPSGIPPLEVGASLLAIAGITWLTFGARKSRPWLFFGWCWYLVTLLPVIGIVQTGMQAMADRYTYVPMIGLLIAVTWQCAETWRARLLVPAAALVLAACAALSWRQIPVWKDGVTLFTHAIEATRDNFVAHDNLGVELDRRGRSEEALAHYRETLRIKPGDRHGEQNYAQATFAKGERLFTQNRSDEALALFREGLRYRPRHALAHTYAGLILTQRNQFTDAIAELKMAIAIDPTLARAHMGLGIALAHAGDLIAARQALRESIRYDPSSFEAHYDLGLILAAMGQYAASLAELDTALRLKPDFEPARSARNALPVKK